MDIRLTISIKYLHIIFISLKLTQIKINVPQLGRPPRFPLSLCLQYTFTCLPYLRHGYRSQTEIQSENTFMPQPSGNAFYRLLSPQPHFHQISPRVFINLYHRWVIRFLHIRQGIDRPQFIKYTQVCVMGFPIQRAVSSCNWFSQNYQTVAVIWLTFPYIFLNACWHPFNWVLASLGISSICPKQLQAFKKI